MKNLFFLALLPALLLVSCSDNDDKWFKGNSITVKANQIGDLPANADIAEVVLKTGYSDIAAHSEWNNGFSLSLDGDAARPDGELGSPFEDSFWMYAAEFTNQQAHEARGIGASVLGYDGNGNLAGTFILSRRSETDYAGVSFVYSDRPFKLKGVYAARFDPESERLSTEFTYDIDMKKGWNTVVTVWGKGKQYDYIAYTTKIPSGLSWSFSPVVTPEH